MKKADEAGHRRLALFYPYRYWATFAALDDLGALLGQAGWQIDLLAPATPDPASHVEGSFRGIKSGASLAAARPRTVPAATAQRIRGDMRRPQDAKVP
jgi:hypothetical protein